MYISNKPELTRKGESRCFVFHEDDIPKVEVIIDEMDSFEYDYMPENWITVWNKENPRRNDLVYNGKFDIDIIELIDRCGQAGIGILIRSTNLDESYV
jgi:hypothetical protein